MSLNPKQLIRSAVINGLLGEVGSRYLEIGLGTGEHYKSIRAKYKVGVDIVANIDADYICASSFDFFMSNISEYDVIFIDGDHRAEQVKEDINNAWECVSNNGVVIVHDLVPPDESHASIQGCGDGFRVLAYILNSGYKDMYTIVDNAGFTVFCSKLTVGTLPQLSYNDFVNIYYNRINFVFPQESLSCFKAIRKY